MTGALIARLAVRRGALAGALVACALAAQGLSPASARQAVPPRPSAASAVPTGQPLADLIARCRLGDTGGAAAEFAKWDARRVAVEATVPASADDATIATLAVLHTGAAILTGAFSGVKPQPTADPQHFAAAHRLVGILGDRTEANPSLRAFCSSWYILAASLWCANGQVAVAERTLRAGHGPLGDDPEFLLTAATIDEALMGPYESPAAAAIAHAPAKVSQNRGEMKRTSHGLLTMEYLAAERRLKKALALRPDLVEARLRLGRVYFLLDRRADARPEFERVLLDAPGGTHPFAAAVAALFLGQLHEAADRFADARNAYERAISLQPADQAPYLALGHLLVASGRVDEGWAAVRRMLEGPGGAPRTSPDSYNDYRMGQAWQANQRMAELEAWARR